MNLSGYLTESGVTKMAYRHINRELITYYYEKLKDYSDFFRANPTMRAFPETLREDPESVNKLYALIYASDLHRNGTKWEYTPGK